MSRIPNARVAHVSTIDDIYVEKIINHKLKWQKRV